MVRSKYVCLIICFYGRKGENDNYWIGIRPVKSCVKKRGKEKRRNKNNNKESEVVYPMNTVNKKEEMGKE